MATDPFKVLRAYDARATWENARKRGADPELVERTLRDIPEVTALEALKANEEAIGLLTAHRWHIMQSAREQGASWAEIGGVLGVSDREAQESYLQAVERREKYVPDLHDAPRARAAVEESPPELG